MAPFSPYGLYKCFDAAYPPAHPVPSCTAVAGYIGEAGKTPHVWTPDEWKHFDGLVQFPIWVPDLTIKPVEDAMHCLSAMHIAGFPVHVPGVVQAVVIDYETAGFPEIGYHSAHQQQLGKYGCDAIAYGSLSSVVQIEAAHIWVADWNDVPTLNPDGQTVDAHQYEANVPYANTRIDFSMVTGWLMQRGYRRT